MAPDSPAIVAIAGRRIDADGAGAARFPLQNVPRVRAEIAAALANHHAVAVVSSAACGADLIALEEAERLGLRRRIVLPFPPQKFREKSVTDRPGVWGPSYDRLIAAAEKASDLVVLPAAGNEDDAGYAEATRAIIREAQALARSKPDAPKLVAVTAWEGASRPGNDITNLFRELALKAGFQDLVIRTD